MSKNWQDSYAKENYEVFKENQSARTPWERDASRFYDFSYGSHFSRAEAAEILAFRQAPIPISITTAICDTAEAMMTASSPTIKVAPILHPFNEQKSQTSKRVAQIYDYLIKKSWYDSLGNLQYDRVVRDYTNVGHGLFYVVPRNEYGEFTVDIKSLRWQYFYPHPQSKDPFYRDMVNAVIAMEIAYEAGYKFVKSIEGNDLTFEQFKEEYARKDFGAVKAAGYQRNRYSPNGQRFDALLFMQRLQLEDQKVYIINPKVDSLNYNGEVKYKVATEITEEMKKLAHDRQITITEERRFVLTEYTSVGTKGYKIVYPISEYNIIPMVYDHRETPYPIGRIWYLYPLQRAINKFMMVAVLNGSLMNSNRVMAEENSIVNVDEWRKNFSVPGAMLRYKLPIPGMSKPPEMLKSEPLSEAWLSMPRYLTYVMEYISGIFGVMMGDSKDSPDVFSTVASLQSAGGQKIKRRMAQADAALSQVGRVVGQFYKEYAPPNGFSAIIDETGQQQEPQLYNVIRKKEGDPTQIEIDPSTDLSLGFKDVRFTSQASNGYESGTEAALLTNLATQLKVPQLVPLILKRLNIADVDKVMDSIDVATQQDSTIQQMEKAIKDLEGRTKVLANQVQQKSFETETAKFGAELDKVMNNVKAQVNNNGGG